MNKEIRINKLVFYNIVIIPITTILWFLYSKCLFETTMVLIITFGIVTYTMIFYDMITSKNTINKPYTIVYKKCKHKLIEVLYVKQMYSDYKVGPPEPAIHCYHCKKILKRTKLNRI